MRKNRFLLYGLLMLGLVLPVACSDKDDEETTGDSTEMEQNYFKVQDAVFMAGAMPAATTSEVLDVDVNTVVNKGEKNTIRIYCDDDYKRIFIGVKGVPGYWVYTPTKTKAVTRAGYDDDDDDDYDWDSVIEITWETSPVSVDDYTLLVSAECSDGSVTTPYEAEISNTNAPEVAGTTTIKANTGARWHMGDFTVGYDSQGRLTSIRQSFENYGSKTYVDMRIDYTSKKIFYTETEEGEGSDRVTYDYVTNDKGYITRMTEDGEGTITFSYNSAGYLTSIDGGYSFVGSLTWNNGNLTSLEFISKDGDGDNMIRSATYGSAGNISGRFATVWHVVYPVPILTGPAIAGLLGVQSKNLPVSIATEEGSFSVSYSFKEDGNISTETWNYMGYVTTYTHH